MAVVPKPLSCFDYDANIKTCQGLKDPPGAYPPLPPVATPGAGGEASSSLDSLVPLRVDLAGGGDGDPGAVERSYKERWEHDYHIFLAFLIIACIIILLGQFRDDFY